MGYNSTYVKTRYEEHDNYGDSGSEEIEDMQIFVFNLGIKYYFSEFINNKVSAYIQAGIGKQFAFVGDESKPLFVDPGYQDYSTDNANEYLEDLNSSFLFNVGFGAEYFFNESLSLNANLRFVYLTYSGDYEYNYNYQSSYETRKIKTEYSEIIKRVGLGLNFYF